MTEISKLQARLKAADLTELAYRAQVSQRQLQRIRDGHSGCTLRTLAKIETGLGQMARPRRKPAAKAAA